MEERVYFISNKTRSYFFDSVLVSYKMNTWEDLSTNLKIRRSLLSKYRAGFLTLPYSLYSILTIKFDRTQKIFFQRHLKFANKTWGQVKGGEITYKKYKHNFEMGREKGLESLRLLRIDKFPEFDINMALNSDLSYFVGLFIGDGFSNVYGKNYITQFVGHKSDELEYYQKIINDISKRLFGIAQYIKKSSKGNYIRVNYYSKQLFLLLTNRFKIKAGRKSYDVLIPEEISKASADILLSCISGIYDAEACVFVDRRKTYKKPYPRIDLHMINPSILKQIGDIFGAEKIPYSFTNNYSHLLIYGKDNIQNFLSKVHLKNPKHLNKINSYFTEIDR